MAELFSVLGYGKIQYSHISLKALYITPRDDYLTSFLISERFLYCLASSFGCEIDQLSLVLTGFAACEMLNLPLIGKTSCKSVQFHFSWVSLGVYPAHFF
mgnify:CR=1 FL=1